MIDFTPIFEAVIALTAALITAAAVPYIKSRTTAQQQEELWAWVKIGVTAAEQTITGTGKGAAKKTYVLDWLKQHGITVDEAKLDAMIESAVFDIKNGVEN